MADRISYGVMNFAQALATLGMVETVENKGARAWLWEAARRDWAVRVLDAWADSQGGTATPSPRHEVFGKGNQQFSLHIRKWHYAASRDAARLAAAEAVWAELPESVRAEIGERP